MELPSLQQISSPRLARLLDLELAVPWNTNDNSAALRQQLEVPLLPDIAACPDVACAQIEAFMAAYNGPKTFGGQLTSETPDLKLLIAIKQFAKHVGNDPANPLSGDAAMVLYFAAIAAGFARCKKRITQLSDLEMREGFLWAMQHPGGETLRLVFAAALPCL